jgi:hypothetical protein
VKGIQVCSSKWQGPERGDHLKNAKKKKGWGYLKYLVYKPMRQK